MLGRQASGLVYACGAFSRQGMTRRVADVLVESRCGSDSPGCRGGPRNRTSANQIPWLLLLLRHSLSHLFNHAVASDTAPDPDWRPLGRMNRLTMRIWCMQLVSRGKPADCHRASKHKLTRGNCYVWRRTHVEVLKKCAKGDCRPGSRFHCSGLSSSSGLSSGSSVLQQRRTLSPDPDGSWQLTPVPQRIRCSWPGA